MSSLPLILYKSPPSYVSANGRPSISAVDVFQVTAGVLSELSVNVSDPDGDAVTLTLDTPLPDGATFDVATKVLQWTPANTYPVNIS